MKSESIYRFLRILNLSLSALTLLMGVFIIFLPLRPEIEYKVSSTLNPGQFSTVKISKEDIKNKIVDVSKNKLIIKKIGVDGELIEGKDKSNLDKGLWHIPSSTPDKGSNTVIAAHRFLYNNGPITFYHLDKLKIGDEFQIIWDKKIYDYKVFDIFEVTPDRVEVEESTKDSIVTLYTCTPLFTSEKRLIVRAKLQ